MRHVPRYSDIRCRYAGVVERDHTPSVLFCETRIEKNEISIWPKFFCLLRFPRFFILVYPLLIETESCRSSFDVK